MFHSIWAGLIGKCPDFDKGYESAKYFCFSTHLWFLTTLVKFRQLHKGLCRHIFLQNTINDGWGRCEKEVEEDQNPIVSHGCSWKSTKELVPEKEVHIGLGTQRGTFDLRNSNACYDCTCHTLLFWAVWSQPLSQRSFLTYKMEDQHILPHSFFSFS